MNEELNQRFKAKQSEPEDGEGSAPKPPLVVYNDPEKVHFLNPPYW